MAHLKTLTAPVTWPVKRKGQKFIIRPNPGKPFEMSLPLSLVFRSLLKYCKTKKEVVAILRDKEIIVDGKRRKDPKYPMGFMDALSIPITNEHYRMLINKNKKLCLVKIPKEESLFKISRINKKTMLKKAVVQLNLFDGRNIIVKKDTYKVGDSLKITYDNKISDVFRMEKGSYAFLIKGKHVGEHGIIHEVFHDKAIIKSGESLFEAKKDLIYVIGKAKPEITLAESK